MTRVYFENWLITEMGFKEHEEEEHIRSFTLNGGTLCGHENIFMEICTTVHFLHISFQLDKKHWVFWKVRWGKRSISRSEHPNVVFNEFFRENGKIIERYELYREQKNTSKIVEQ